MCEGTLGLLVLSSRCGLGLGARVYSGGGSMDSLRGRVVERRAEMRLGMRLMRLVSMFFVLVLVMSLIE